MVIIFSNSNGFWIIFVISRLFRTLSIDFWVIKIIDDFFIIHTIKHEREVERGASLVARREIYLSTKFLNYHLWNGQAMTEAFKVEFLVLIGATNFLKYLSLVLFFDTSAVINHWDN